MKCWLNTYRLPHLVIYGLRLLHASRPPLSLHCSTSFMNNRVALLRNGSAVVSLIDVNPLGHRRELVTRFVANQAIPRARTHLRITKEKVKTPWIFLRKNDEIFTIIVCYIVFIFSMN